MNRDKIENLTWLSRVLFGLAAAILFAMIFAGLANAAPVENEGGAANGIFIGEHMKLGDDENAYYIVDTAEKTKEEMDQNIGSDFMDKVGGLSPRNIAKNNASALMEIAVQNIFEFNQMMTNFMITALNFGFQSNIVDSLIETIDGTVKEISGLSGVQIGGGLFGQFVVLAVLLSIFVAIFQLLGHSAIAGFRTIGKAVAALCISFVLIGNFGPIMKGMNDTATWLSASVLTGTTNFITTEDRDIDGLMKAVDKNLWDLFIGKPYLIMQYGTDDVGEIGEERINELLLTPPGDERAEYVQDIEVGENNNDKMTVNNTGQRLAFSALYSVLNILVSAPVYGIALAHVIFELWFLLIAFLAPIVAIWSVFPKQLKVLERYAVELAYPLLMKVLVSFVMVFIFGIGFVAYAIPSVPGAPQYFSAAIIQFSLFALLFLVRKRVVHIFAASELGPMNRVADSIRDLRHTVSKVNGAANKTGRVVTHAALGAVTGGASVGASNLVETAIALKNKRKSDTDSPTKPMAKMNKETTAAKPEVSPSRPTATVKTEQPAERPVEKKVVEEYKSKPFAKVKGRVIVKKDKIVEEKERDAK